MAAPHAHRAPRGVWVREGGPDATVPIVSTMRSTFHADVISMMSRHEASIGPRKIKRSSSDLSFREGEATPLRANARRHAEESWQAIALGGGEDTSSSDVPAREGQPRVLL
jgi:hypothetical protein